MSTRVVTVGDFHSMIIVSENISVSRYHGIQYKQSKQVLFWLNKCLEAFAYSNQVNLIIDYTLV